MTKREALALLHAGRSREWNMYRQAHPDWIPDLSGTNLKYISFVLENKPVFDLSKANLCGAALPQEAALYKNVNEEVNLEGAIVDAGTVVFPEYDPNSDKPKPNRNFP
jgi:hypothetical protein